MASAKIQIIPAILTFITCCIISVVSCYFSSEPNRLIIAVISCIVLSVYAIGFSSVSLENTAARNLLTALSVFFFLCALALNFFAEYLSFTICIYLPGHLALLASYLLVAYIIVRK